MRLAISGQLGADALSSDEMMETLKLCVSCKACRHECPTGVDMAKMKIEVLAARAATHGLTLRDRLVGYLPRYAGLASRFAPLANLRNQQPAAAKAVRALCRHQRAAARCPHCRSDVFVPPAEAVGPETGREVVLFADTFNRIYERENLDDALRVLAAGGYRVHLPKPASGSRPLCCGRTFLSAGLVDEATCRTRSARRRLRALRRARRADRRARAELPADAARRTRCRCARTTTPRRVGAHALLFEEFLVREAEAGRLQLPLGTVADKVWCTAIATRNPSARSSRSSRCCA